MSGFKVTVISRMHVEARYVLSHAYRMRLTDDVLVYVVAGLSVGQTVDQFLMMRRLPLMSVLVHEVQCYDRLLSTIHHTLSTLCSAVKGEMVMSDALEDTYDKLLKNIVPSNWMVCAVLICYALFAPVRKIVA